MIIALAASVIGADNESGYMVAVKRAAFAKTPEAHDARQAAHLLFRKPPCESAGLLFFCQESTAGISESYGWWLAIGADYGKRPRHRQILSQRLGAIATAYGGRT